MNKFLLSTALVITNLTATLAQSSFSKVEGSVLNEKKEPIEYATVLLRQAQDSTLVMGTTTSETGAFVFNSNNDSTYPLGSLD